MNIFTNMLFKEIDKEAKRLAKEVISLYRESKKINPSKPEMEIIRGLIFNENKLDMMAPESRQRINTCCQNLYGLCYMIALDMGKFKNLINVRAIQFTQAMDKELESYGIAPQSIETKTEILKVMELDFPGWQNVC